MTIFPPFLFGFLAAAIGIFPPGLINMTAAKISILDGRLRGMMFVLGALIVIFFQTYISVIFANYINQHQEIVVLFREIGFAVMMSLSIYFFVFAKKQKNKKTDELKVKSKKSRFFMGMMVSAINVFPIPYYVLISVTLASYKLFVFETLPIYSFVSGVVLGSFLGFYCYVVFFEKVKSKTDFFIKNLNIIIGSITGFVALVTLLNLLK